MRVRPFTESDFPVAARVLADDERFHGRASNVGVNELREWTSTADLANDSWLYEDADGPLAVGWCAAQGDAGFAVGVVHPRAKGRGLGAELVDRSEAVLRTRDVVGIHQFVVGADSAAAALLTARGYNGGGYVGALGVRRPWRGKGYAKALLLHTFREFYERGMPRVTLGVDSGSSTGAVQLYERFGMHVEAENVVFEKSVAEVHA